MNVFTWSGALDIFRPTYKLLECDIIRSSRTAGRAWGTSHGVMTGGLHPGSFEANVLHASHGVMTGGLHPGSFEANVLHAASI